jgi:hypothetical protein
MSVRRPTVDELSYINNRLIKSEKKLAQDDAWVIDVEAAKSGVQTAYFSSLSKKSIENFSKNTNARARNRNAKAIGYYLNHDTVSRLPMGVLFDGKTAEDGDQLAFQHKVFLPANFSTGDVNTDDYVRSVEYSMSEDVSVGFLSKKFICDICNNDIRSEKCRHWPGMRYNVGTEDEPRYVVCTYTVDDAKLVEVSAAWKGALPGARVLSDNTGADNILPQQFDIKRFAEGTYLRFSYSANGGIEQLDDITAQQLLLEDHNGGSVMENEFEVNEDLMRELEAVAALMGDEELTEQHPANSAEQEESEQLTPEQRRVEVLQNRAAELEEAYVELQEEIETLRAQFDRAVEELAESNAVSERYVSEIDSEVHKLSIGIDAEIYSKDVVDSVLSKMSLDEKLSYRNSLRIKLGKALRTGRLTTDEAPTQRTLNESVDPSVYRTGR